MDAIQISSREALSMRTCYGERVSRPEQSAIRAVILWCASGNREPTTFVYEFIMFSDLKLAVRKLGKSPGFALTAIATLALGIGANAVVFSVLNALILRPVNVPHAQNLYTVQRYKYPSQSYPDY